MARIVIVGGGAVDPIDCDDGSNTRTVRENLLGGYGKGILKRDRMLFVKENLEAGEYEYHLTAQATAPSLATNITMNAYLDFLRQHPMIQNQPAGVNSRVVGLIVKDRGLYAAMMGCVTPIQAFELYTRALQVFSTHAKQEIEQFTNHTLLIAERIDLEARTNTFIYRAFQPAGAFFREFYFKVKAGADLRKEEVVWQRIRAQFGPNEAATFFVETILVQVARPLTNHPGLTSGLLSPIMLGTLFDLSVSVTKHLVKAVYTAMKKALSMMHSLDMVHCDLKPQNILRDNEGRYHLADYDGCVATGASVGLSTRRFWPLDMQQQESSSVDLPATPCVDFAMLAATLLFLADQWNFLTVTQPTLADMRTTALVMKARSECGADEILECITLANGTES